jgi:hypothetical protein
MWWTLAATIIASATALLIAFVAYPWQKAKDRELQIQSEKRSAYADYLWALKRLELAITTGDDESAVPNAIDEARRHFHNMILYAPVEIIRQAREITALLQLLEHEIELMEQGDPQFRGRTDGVERVVSDIHCRETRLMRDIRIDILGCSEDEADAAASLIFAEFERKLESSVYGAPE